MKTNYNVVLRVCGSVYADAPKSWRILYVKGRTIGSYSTGHWFPKKVCSYEPNEKGDDDGKLTIPHWLFDILPSKSEVTLWQEKELNYE